MCVDDAIDLVFFIQPKYILLLSRRSHECAGGGVAASRFCALLVSPQILRFFPVITPFSKSYTQVGNHQKLQLGFSLRKDVMLNEQGETRIRQHFSRSVPRHRKQSLEQLGNPFSGCGTTWLQRGGEGGGGAVMAMLQPALRSALPPDALLAAARDSAPELAARLSAQQIHEMVRLSTLISNSQFLS